MKVRNLGWASVCAFTVSMSLYFLRKFNVIGSEYDILVNFFSVITLILTTVFVGVLFSAQTHVRASLIAGLLVAVAFISAPFVAFLSIPLIDSLPVTALIKGLISWALFSGYLLGWMAFILWLKKKGILKPSETDSMETGT